MIEWGDIDTDATRRKIDARAKKNSQLEEIKKICKQKLQDIQQDILQKQYAFEKQKINAVKSKLKNPIILALGYLIPLDVLNIMCDYSDREICIYCLHFTYKTPCDHGTHIIEMHSKWTDNFYFENQAENEFWLECKKLISNNTNPNVTVKHIKRKIQISFCCSCYS